MHGGLYKRRTPEKSDLSRIACQYFEKYEKIYNVLKNVQHLQWVFTIPKVLRRLFYKDRMLLAELARCAAATILELYKAIFRDNYSRNDCRSWKRYCCF